MTARYDDIEVGFELPGRTVLVGRGDLVRYAGASGDFNPIHYSDAAARALGLPSVIAHGMLTMAQAAAIVVAWIGDPARICEYSVRFTHPVHVPDDTSGVAIRYEGKVAAKLDDARVRVDLTATTGSQAILGAARAVVRLD